MAQQKKIIILGSAYPLRGGGITTFNESLATSFQQQGYDISIWSFSLQYPALLFPGKTQVDTDRTKPGLKIESPINSINPFNWIAVGNRLKKEKPDIIVVRYWLPFMAPALGTILRIAKKNNHSRIICIADNIIPHEKRPGDSAFTNYFIPPVDAFITMSEKVFIDLQNIAPQKKAVKVGHPLYDNFGEITGQEEARKKLGISAGSLIFLFFGFIRKYKGLDILLHAIDILKKTRPDLNVQFLIAGEFYGDSKIYDDLIQQLNIRDKLIMRTDFIPDEEVKYYLCASDCVIQPYRNATQSGVTPLAYHFEIPMIVTNVGGLAGMVPKGAGLVADPNPNSLELAIEKYISLGKEYFLPVLREEKKKYSWKNLTDTIIDLAS